MLHYIVLHYYYTSVFKHIIIIASTVGTFKISIVRILTVSGLGWRKRVACLSDTEMLSLQTWCQS